MSILNAEIDERALSKAALQNAEHNLRTLCASQAPTFVAVERRGALLTSALNILQKSIHDATPNVISVKQSLLDQSNQNSEKVNNLSTLTERHRVRRRTLLQHSALLELLELPSLMDACVRSNLYEDALSVAAFANSLERRHLQQQQDSIGEHRPHTVVANVVSEVRMREGDLRRHLLQRLRSEMTMPQCLEVVTALRRLNGVELERKSNSATTIVIDLESVHAAMELSLVVEFFEARDLWLDSPSSSSSNSHGTPLGIAMNTASSSTAQSELLLDMIERYRTRCFEIATQFLAIFRTSSTSSSIENNNNTTSLSLLSLWTTRRIQMFLKSLTNHLTHINDCAILRDALDATLFFSTSMGRIGADFQALLPPIFEPQLIHIVTNNNWEDQGLITFEKTLKICRDAGVASPLYTHSNNASIKEEDNTSQTKEDSSSTTPSPPRILLSYPPLARLLNAYLTGLNELRRCLLPGVFTPLQQHSQSFYAKVKHVLQVNERAVLTPGLSGEATKLREIASDMKVVFEDIVMPFMEQSLLVALGLYVEPPPLPPAIEEEATDDDQVGDSNNSPEEAMVTTTTTSSTTDVDKESIQEEEKVCENQADDDDAGNNNNPPEETIITTTSTTDVDKEPVKKEDKSIDNEDEEESIKNKGVDITDE